MDAPGDPTDEAVDDVEDLLAPEDDSAAGKDMARDDDPVDEADGSGLPPEGDDPMDGVAPSG